ncbi:hypothetical protein NDU88_005490 [Pleurodeles waltl]|uniref:Uncharacterized protein n=1 Tax=Pleurodeles waltl TaxID=8319 RepID=A0AAV7VNN9_PLEWA|nr:hypothetical protein NDU88_005490 [Pleurodeles waltl]
MYRPQYHNLPIRHLFRGRFTANINTVETRLRRENALLYTPHEESGRHATRAPDPACPHLLAPLPGARTPAAKTTVGSDPLEMGSDPSGKGRCPGGQIVFRPFLPPWGQIGRF